MTINGSTNMTMNDSLGHKVDKRCKKIWCVTEAKLYNSVTEFADVHKMPRQSVYDAIIKKRTTCNGLKITYEEDVAKTQNIMADDISEKNAEIAKLKAEMEALKADAELGRKTRLEQEAARKAEENRIKAIKKADNKVELRQRTYDRKMEEAKHAYARLMEAKQARQELGEAM